MEHCCGPEHDIDGRSAAAPVPPSAPEPAPGPAGCDDSHTVTLPGGRFRMGTDDVEGFPADREGPVREVAVAAFAIDTGAVTNERFATFVAQTGWVTDAERFGWSFVFAGFLPDPVVASAPRAAGTPWWCGISGATWSSPLGPGSDLDGLADHPVVHVSHDDALAFCRWAGRRLPTEAEWEYAARGGLDQARFPWGDELTPGGEHRCNIWQGTFPSYNSRQDGYVATAPVTAYAPNGFGLHNVAGNVWEWTADWFDERRAARAIRGGSYLCHHTYCNRYRVAARSSNTADSSTGNTGFRCVTDNPRP